MGSAVGASVTAARRVGVEPEVYAAQLAAGRKWCGRCREFHDREAFPADRSRGDGLASSCSASRNAAARASYQPTQRPEPGRRFTPARDGDKAQARRRVNYLVEIDILPNPNTLVCTNCGHLGADKRHEYHHHNGYDADHHEDVVPLCSSCHHDEELTHGRQDQDRMDA